MTMKMLKTTANVGLSMMAVSLSLLGGGCSADPVGYVESELHASDASVSSHESKKLTIYTWDEYFSPEVLEAFEKQSGVDVIYETFTEADEMIENIRSFPGKYDIVVIDGPYLNMLKDARLIRELNRSTLGNFEHIDEQFTGLDFDPENRISVPYMWGTSLLAYRNDMIEDPEESWQLLFDERYAGKQSILLERSDCIPSALFSLGLDPNTENPNDYEKAEEMLVTLVRDNRGKFGTDNEMKEHLLSGKSWVALMYSGDAALIADPETNVEENISFFIPQEGAVFWVDSFAITRDSSNSDLAHDFLNYMMTPQVAAESSNYLWYATANKAAKPFLDEELQNDKTIYPKQEVLNRCKVLSQGPTQERLMNLSWKNVEKAADDQRVVADVE